MTDWLEEGANAPDFTLPADDGTKVKLSAFRGQPVVLYFYPKDDTADCSFDIMSLRIAILTRLTQAFVFFRGRLPNRSTPPRQSAGGTE